MVDKGIEREDVLPPAHAGRMLGIWERHPGLAGVDCWTPNSHLEHFLLADEGCGTQDRLEETSAASQQVFSRSHGVQDEDERIRRDDDHLCERHGQGD